jgi:hypothetical protein
VIFTEKWLNRNLISDLYGSIYDFSTRNNNDVEDWEQRYLGTTPDALASLGLPA